MGANFDKIVLGWMRDEKMSGYIKKSTLAEELLNLAIAGKDKIKISSVINMIEGLPAADVVEVVRCKDCADFRPWGGQSKLGDCMVYVCDGENPFTMEETDFCSDGDRRGGED